MLIEAVLAENLLKTKHWKSQNNFYYFLTEPKLTIEIQCFLDPIVKITNTIFEQTKTQLTLTSPYIFSKQYYFAITKNRILDSNSKKLQLTETSESELLDEITATVTVLTDFKNLKLIGLKIANTFSMFDQSHWLLIKKAKSLEAYRCIITVKEI